MWKVFKHRANGMKSINKTKLYGRLRSLDSGNIIHLIVVFLYTYGYCLLFYLQMLFFFIKKYLYNIKINVIYKILFDLVKGSVQHYELKHKYFSIIYLKRKSKLELGRYSEYWLLAIQDCKIV